MTDFNPNFPGSVDPTLNIATVALIELRWPGESANPLRSELARFGNRSDAEAAKTMLEASATPNTAYQIIGLRG